jgi:hypothetical protein
MYLSTGTGGIIGCIFAGLMTEFYHPKWCFFYYSFVGLVVSIFACRLTKQSEKNKIKTDSASVISTSQENYEFEVRRQRIEGGQSIESLNRVAIPKRDGFCFNLRKNC